MSAFSDISTVHDADAIAIAGEVASVVRARVKQARLPSPEEAAALRSRMLRDVGAGDWSGYVAWLTQKARQYATDEIPLTAWYDVTVAFTRAMIRRLGEAYPTDARRVTAAVLALQDFGDRGMATFTAEYNRTRDELFRANVDARLRAEARFRILADSGVVGILVAHMDGTIIELNDAIVAMLGYSREDILSGRVAWPKLTPPEWSNVDARAVEELAKRGATVREKEYIHQDGHRVPVLVATAITDPSQNEALSFILDIGDRKRAESALRESEERNRQMQKMEAVGKLAGGIAHDFNNLLSVILSYSDIVLEQLPQGDSMRGELAEIRRAGMRAEELTRQLLAFSRKQILQPTIVDVNAVVAHAEKLLHRLIGEHIELSLALSPDVWRTHADAGQLEQVIMNLVINARDAMPGGGKLRIETSNVRIDSTYGADVTPGDYVMLAVTDNGVGMDGETKKRAFEPFFTTKSEGKGTGLGLATAFGIVKQSGGHISLYSELGYGTTCKVYLPRTNKSSHATPARGMPRVVGGNETILVVEDEEQVRAVTRTILRRGGYDVLEARNGEAALAIVDEHEGPIHLVITDVVMPKMSGREVVERILPRRPTVKVLYVSGYTEDAIVHHGVLDEGIEFLAKPVMPDALLRKVRAILDVG